MGSGKTLIWMYPCVFGITQSGFCDVVLRVHSIIEMVALLLILLVYMTRWNTQGNKSGTGIVLDFKTQALIHSSLTPLL